MFSSLVRSGRECDRSAAELAKDPIQAHPAPFQGTYWMARNPYRPVGTETDSSPTLQKCAVSVLRLLAYAVTVRVFKLVGGVKPETTVWTFSVGTVTSISLQSCGEIRSPLIS